MGLPCTTRFAALQAFLRRSKMLLTFSRHQIMYNVFCVVPCAEVTYQGYFLIQQKSKEKKIKH